MIGHFLRTLGMAALVAAPLQAQQDSATVAKNINDLETQWGASLSAGNWDAVATFLAPGYVMTGGDGKRVDRAAYLANFRDSGVKYSASTAGPYTVIVSGGTAVHLGEATFSVTSKNGKVTRVHEVWTDTWVLQANGMWLCVASQLIDHPLK